MKFTGCAWIAVAIISVAVLETAYGKDASQAQAPARRTPPPLPPMPPTPPTPPAGSRPVMNVARPAKLAPAVPVLPPVPAPPPQPSQPGALPGNVIAWESEQKEYTAKFGEMSAPFTFYFTNVSAGEVLVTSVGTSCGCTVAQLPALPWKLPPGTNAAIPVTMNLAGKQGIVIKTITFNTDKGYKSLMVKTTIQPPLLSPQVVAEMDRQRNQEMARTNRQAVFNGDCARCHVDKAKGKLGQELYATACGICHEAEHRATMVADLHAIKQDTNPEFWRTWIAHGKAGTLMPAFAKSEGGPLSDEEIESLVQYLIVSIAPRGTTRAGRPATN